MAKSTDYYNGVKYYITVPATNYATSDAVKKTTNSPDMVNDVTYFGWEGSTVYSWVFKNSDLSSRTDITGTHPYNMRISQDFADKYKNQTVRLKLKTSTTTMHACDVNGKFYPDR